MSQSAFDYLGVKMMRRHTILVVMLLCAFAWINCVVSQDIVFPDDDDSDLHVSGGKPITERKPIKSSQCAEHMLLYADDGPRSAWVCDCKPLFVYFPLNDSCHEAYRRGPCPENHYVYLPLNESLPSCVENPCVKDGVVPFDGSCYPLGMKEGPCKDSVLGVNETTFQLQCLSTDIETHVIIDAPKKACPKGSRRNSLGICKHVL